MVVFMTQICPSLPPCSTIMAAVSLLPEPPRVRHVASVTEWLGHLELSHLQASFEGYTLKKLSTLWDIQLASVHTYLAFSVGVASVLFPNTSL